MHLRTRYLVIHLVHLNTMNLVIFDAYINSIDIFFHLLLLLNRTRRKSSSSILFIYTLPINHLDASFIHVNMTISVHLPHDYHFDKELAFSLKEDI